ncbi:extracellular solute-binding protein family 5 [[Leptolyngbya] sp. PCC 7376]|uniref:peptide ABC transporter substrate-binding protein n=1 Tax=[Leptolyngbya] sp. PCC 7376 TaxID=111781 RepID=UPI00029F382F|nr:peptide ABC transporter substrate-binding protein [[Leptolyngbya] sp. PCC 7376]AFY38032.1 extracellular solute-binding protein family 5 [[Leptolyngbya] sp. PCC 7376]
MSPVSRFAISASLVSLLGLTACGGTQISPSSQTTTDDTTLLKLLYWQAPTILNPHLSTGFKDWEASRITLEPLATFNEESELIPILAAEIPSIENGGVAEDGLSVTWTLKQDIQWSDGEPFTAADVVFTYEWASNPDTGATSLGIFEVIDSVEAIDDLTVKVTFKEIAPAWFGVFVGSEGMILPKHEFEEYQGTEARTAPANLMPVGTGAYRVAEFKPGDVVVYEKNPNYRDAETVSFERIELKGGGDATSAARAVLQTGDADFAYNLQVESKILDELSQGGQGEVVASYGSLGERIILNFTDPNKETAEGERSSTEFPHPFLTDIKVREAIAIAIDRDTITEELYGITGTANANFVVNPPELVSLNTSYEFDLEKANTLLDEAGWVDSNGDGTRDKDGVEMTMVFQTSVNPLRQKTQVIAKQNLRELGIDVELKSIDASVFFSGDPANADTTERFVADLQMFTTGNTNPDPMPYLKRYTCDQIPTMANSWTGDNYSRYCNSDYDELWTTTNKELDPAKRQAAIIEMNDLLINNFVVIPLVHRAETAGVSSKLSGVSLTPWDMNTWNIAEWKKISETTE